MTFRDWLFRRIHPLPDRREQARAETLTFLFTSLLAVLVPFMTAFAFILHARPTDFAQVVYAAVALAAMQVVSRTRWYRWSAAWYLVSSVGSVLAGVLNHAASSFFFFGPAYLVASIYFSVSAQWIYFAATTLGTLAGGHALGFPISDVVSAMLGNGLVFAISISAIRIRKADAERIREEAALAASALQVVAGKESQWESMLRTAPLGMFQTDPSGRLTFINEHLRSWVGLNETAGVRTADLFENDSAIEFQESFSAYRAGAMDELQKELHLRAHHKGVDQIVRVRLTRQRKGNGDLLGYFATVEDVTELRAANERSVQSARLATLGELSANVAHELNNPLTVLGVHLESLYEQSEKWGDFARHSIRLAQGASNTIRNIADGLRGVARKSVTLGPVNLVEVLKNTQRFFATLIQKTGLRFEVDVGGQPVWVEGDSGKIQQVLVNLLSNARDALKGRGDGVVRMALRVSPGAVQIEVRDNGPGIPKELQSRVLNSGFTTKASGTGLGLGISSRIAQEHRGALRFTSDSQGTAFVFQLPRAHVSPGAVEAVSSRRVLIIDDEADLRETLKTMLESLGYQVDEADRGRTALSAIGTHRYAAVLSDVTMPGLSGEELFRAICDHPNFGGKLIVISGYAAEGDLEQRFGSIPVSAYIQKPYTKADLVRALDQALVPPKEKRVA